MANLENLRKFVEILIVRREKDFDNFIVVTGIKGSGKSTLLYWIGREYMKALGRDFDLEKHVIYSDNFKEIFEKIRNAQDGDYIWFDEGGRIILAEDWNTANSRKLKKMFSEIRTKHLCIGFACPFAFTKIDVKYREALLNFWIWVPKRGTGFVFEQSVHPTQGGFLEKIIEKKLKVYSWTDSLKEGFEENLLITLKPIPTFLDLIRFVSMPEKEHERYLVLRDKYVYEEKDEKEERQSEKFMRLVFKTINEMINQNKKLTVIDACKTLAQELNTNPNSLRAYYYEVRKKLEQSG